MLDYICAEWFMIRTPVLSIEYFKEGIEKEDIFEYIVNKEGLVEYFQKALYIGSETLYSSFLKNIKKGRVEEDVNLSLLKYFIRATTRPTPFGYFSSVALGRFGERESLIKESCNMLIDTDHKWITNIISELEKKQEVIEKIAFNINNNCYKYGKRYYNPYCSNMGISTINIAEENDIKYLEIVKYIFETIEKGKKYKEIVEAIKYKYGEIDIKIINDILRKLIESEYIYTEVRIPSYCKNELLHIYNVLDAALVETNIKEKIFSLENKIRKFNLRLESGDNDIGTIEDIRKNMEDICEQDVNIKVDTSMKMKEAILPISVKEKIERYAKLLGLLSIETMKYKPISSFIEDFQEEYGVGVEVNVVELINPHGFNALKFMENGLDSENNIREKEISSILQDKIMKSIFVGQDEINFEYKDFKDIENKNVKWPKSFDINIFMSKNQEEYQLYAGPNVGSIKAGAMFQRFAECFSCDEFENYNKIYSIVEEIVEEDYINVAMIEEPAQSKISNIINKTKNYKYTLSLGTYLERDENEISLEDLYIGLDFEMMPYIKSKKLNKKVKIVLDNMLNINSTCKIGRFLLLISSTYEKDPLSRIFEFINLKHEYFPQISFENVVISPKRWIFKEKNIKNEKQFIDSFSEFALYYGLNAFKFLYLCVNDNRLIINLENKMCIKILYHEYKRRKIIYLSAIEKNILDSGLVSDKMGNYVTEFVFSVYLKKEMKSIIKDVNLQKPYLDSSKREIVCNHRKLSIFENGWVYIKIYGLGNRVNEFLCKDIIDIVRKLNYIPFFFIRYYDKEGAHIRVRFKLSNRNEVINNLKYIIAWTEKIILDKRVFQIKFDNYTREVNRYGGKELIELCEAIFCVDSELIIEIFKKFNMENKEEVEYIYLCGISFFLKYLCGSVNSALNVMEEYGINSHSNPEYKKRRNYYINLLDQIFDKNIFYNGKLNKNIIHNILCKLEILKKRMDSCCNLTVSKSELIFSIIHMHCNRITGNRMLEEKYLNIIRCGLYQKMLRDKNIRKEGGSLVK